MNQSMFPENNIFSFTKSSMVLFVEDSYNPKINDFIKTNYKDIVDTFNSKDIDFCYLPYLLQDKDYQNVVSYNRPYLHNSIDGIPISEVYSKIKSKLTDPLDGPGLVFIDMVLDLSEVVYGYPINERVSLIEQFDKFATAIYETFNDDFILSKGDNKPMFKIGKNDVSDLDFGVLHEPKIDYNKEQAEKKIFSDICYSIELNADDQFDYEAYRLADEIRTRIQQLKESGALKLIADIFEGINIVSNKLSSIFITNDYRIFLKEYGMKEVIMAPLPKSLYILFLRHPEGILFKQLSDFHDELLSIYRNVTIHEDIDRAKGSIRAMTNPLDNSVNEKCSRIRTAFLNVIADDLAQNYYVTGERAKPKKIILDRSLVEFQQ
jgi:hypothetical protein